MLDPVGWGVPDPRNTPSCGNWTLLIKQYGHSWHQSEKNEPPLVGPFKVTQGHRNWHGSIGYLWLPVSPSYPRTYLVPFQRYTAISFMLTRWCTTQHNAICSAPNDCTLLTVFYIIHFLSSTLYRPDICQNLFTSLWWRVVHRKSLEMHGLKLHYSYSQQPV